MLLMRLLLLVVMMMMLVVLCVVVVMAFDPNALALASSPFLFIIARAQPSPILLIPGTQWLAAKCKVVILDDSGDRPWVAAEIDLADSGVRDMEVRDEEIGLGSPVVR
jgi:hypothetical protein